MAPVRAEGCIARAAWGGQDGEGAVWGPPAAPRAAYGGRGCAPPWGSVAEHGRARAVRGVWGAAGRGPGPPGGGSRCRAWYRGGVVCAPRPRLNSRGENCPAARHPPLRGTRGRLPQPALLRGAALPNPTLPSSALPSRSPSLSAGLSVHGAHQGAGQHLQAQQQNDGR